MPAMTTTKTDMAEIRLLQGHAMRMPTALRRSFIYVAVPGFLD